MSTNHQQRRLETLQITAPSTLVPPDTRHVMCHPDPALTCPSLLSSPSSLPPPLPLVDFTFAGNCAVSRSPCKHREAPHIRQRLPAFSVIDPLNRPKSRQYINPVIFFTSVCCIVYENSPKYTRHPCNAAKRPSNRWRHRAGNMKIYPR